ncbi:hypothetical protein BaRGS_00040396, partial [Batillaria attramentaria]
PDSQAFDLLHCRNPRASLTGQRIVTSSLLPRNASLGSTEGAHASLKPQGVRLRQLDRSEWV